MKEFNYATHNSDPINKLSELQLSQKLNFPCITGLILTVPYGASIGGIATLTGTPPNLVFKAAFETAFPKGPTVDFATWISFSYPISLLLVLAGWHILVIVYARRR